VRLGTAIRTLLAAGIGTGAIAASAGAVEPGVVIGPRGAGHQNVDAFNASRDLGARWVRIYVNWPGIETADNHYDAATLGEFDRRVAEHTARGQKVLMVVSYSPGWASGSSDQTAPPRDPGKYAEFMAAMASRYRGKVSAWELWNEPDDSIHYRNGPQPAEYAALVRAAYPAIKAADPAATVVTGGMVGNNYRFLEALYAHGVKGSFDAVGVHTDTACLTAAPDFQYREPDGRIGRFAFTGYREVRRSMLANGEDKPIWMTELGWNTSPAVCDTGGRKGTKPGGVSEAKQAQHLEHAFGCLQSDGYVPVALWFSLQDVDGSSTTAHRFGLLDDGGKPKPSHAAFRRFATDPSPPARRCGTEVDAQAPQVKLLSPRDGQQYLDSLVVRANASDDQGVTRMELYADGKKVPGSQKGGRFRLTWRRARHLSMGRHRITVKARDAAKNVGQASVTVVRDRAGNIRVPRARFHFSVKRSRGSRTLRVAGRVQRPKGTSIKPKGRIRMFFEIKLDGRWKVYSRYTKGIRKPFALRVRLRKPGTWRVWARYAAQAPYQPLRTRYRVFRGMR
jgi:hypothetical protein